MIEQTIVKTESKQNLARELLFYGTEYQCRAIV
jgi:hypothetical protein